MICLRMPQSGDGELQSEYDLEEIIIKGFLFKTLIGLIY